MFEPIDTVIDGRYVLPPPLRRVNSGNRTVCIGLDCGQVRDYSAICVVEYQDMLFRPGDPLCGEPPVYETHYRVLGAERLELGTSYPDVARRVSQIAKRLYDRDSRGDFHCLVDVTGVGKPVSEIISRLIIPAFRMTAVTLTGSSKGDNSIFWRHESNVGKAWLVSRLQAILQSGRLHAPRDPLLLALIDELKVFEIRIKPETGHEQTGAFQVGKHDDLCTALCLCCASDLQSVTYGPEVNFLPSPRM